MDRQTVYAGQIPLETDQLRQSQNAMVALAKLAAAVLGQATIVNGFTCTPTTPASLNVLVTAGEVYQLENLEQSAWSSLSADTHTILKQGVILDPATFGIVPPTTVGYSQNFLVEVQYQDVDSGATVLPYFNASTPSVPFAGPGNAGSAQNTVRKGVASLQVKAGIAAATGTQTTPTADAGWTGIYVVTVANGATTITSGNIAQVPLAPFIPVTLPNVPAGVQSGQWLYGVDTGAVNAMVASVTPIPTQLVPGMTIHIRTPNTNTGATTLNLNGLGASAIHRANGAALSAGDINANMVVELVWDGSAWQIANYFGFTSSTVNNNTYTLTIPYAADSSGAANTVTATFSPAITSLSAGQEILVKLANTNTGATTIVVNSLAAVPVVNSDGSALNAGQIVGGEMLWLLYDGTRFQVANPSMSNPTFPPFFPEMLTTGAIFSFTTATGSVTINTNQSWVWRGVTKFSTTAFAGGGLVWTTAASKTYHLRWYAPGTGRATPSTSYPNGRFYLEDIADASVYNTGALGEYHPFFDTTYDSMLIAKVVTDASNNATVTPLLNKAYLLAYGTSPTYASSTDTNLPFDSITVITLNWSRRPRVTPIAWNIANAGAYFATMLVQFDEYIDSWDGDNTYTPAVHADYNNRYSFAGLFAVNGSVNYVNAAYDVRCEA